MINGEISQQVSVNDRGLHYGDGVFETLVALNGELQHWGEHIRRLEIGCQRLKIQMPDAQLLKKETLELVRQENSSGQPKLIIKIIISRGIGKRGYKPPLTTQVTRIISLYPYPDYPAQYFSEGVKITVCNIPLSCNPVLAGIKHLNRLEQVMAQEEWSDPDILDGVMLNNDQHVIECTMSNIFWVSNNQLFTPNLTNCGVEGVTRTNILRLAKELQISTKISEFYMKDLLAADEIMISNSVFGILPVRAVDSDIFPVGPLTRQLMRKFEECKLIDRP
jgi:4-amino-4-deoxychorismate lyase